MLYSTTPGGAIHMQCTADWLTGDTFIENLIGIRISHVVDVGTILKICRNKTETLSNSSGNINGKKSSVYGSAVLIDPDYMSSSVFLPFQLLTGS